MKRPKFGSLIVVVFAICTLVPLCYSGYRMMDRSVGSTRKSFHLEPEQIAHLEEMALAGDARAGQSLHRHYILFPNSVGDIKEARRWLRLGIANGWSWVNDSHIRNMEYLEQKLELGEPLINDAGSDVDESVE